MGCVELEMQGEMPIIKVKNNVKNREMRLRTCTVVQKN